jgi:hypothetical protein
MLDVMHLPVWGDAYVVIQEVPVLALKIMQ